MRNVIVLIGAGSIGQAIVRRIGAGRHILLADLRQENAEAAANPKRSRVRGERDESRCVIARFRACARQTATAWAMFPGLIHAAGVSPSQASPETILKSISTERRWCWKNSAMLSPAAARAS